MTTTGDARVVLLGRAGCHLCDDARVVVREVAAETGVDWTEVDVDVAAATDGGALQREYGEQVPVVLVDGVPRGFWRIDPGRLRRALAAPEHQTLAASPPDPLA